MITLGHTWQNQDRIRRFTVAFRFTLGLAMLAAATTALAQSPEKVLKAATKALGGEKAIRNVRSWQASGAIQRRSDGRKGGYKAVAEQPNLFAVSYDAGGFEISNGYNGKSGWSRDSRSGLRTLTGAASRDFQFEAGYRNTRWLAYKSSKAKITSGGSLQIDGKACNQVVMTTQSGTRIKLYFDAASNLLVREEIGMGERSSTYDYSDYRQIDGIQEPFKITLAVGDERYDISLDQFVHNQPLASAQFDFPKDSNQPLPDITRLLAEVRANEDRVEKLRDSYGYTQTSTTRTLDTNGALLEGDSETHELSFFKGTRITRLIAKNGKPLSASEQAEEDKDFEKRVTELEKRQAERERKMEKERTGKTTSTGPASDDEHRRVSVADILRASKLTNPRWERFKNRDVIVFDFEPQPGYQPRKDYEKFFGKTAGVIWVDASDKQVARLEAQLVENYQIGGGLLASLKKGGSFVFEQERVNNEIWLPTRSEIGLSAKVLLFKSVSRNEIVTYGNYKRYDAKVVGAEVDSPPEAKDSGVAKP